ncbi:MAG: hypothetical protein ACLP4R_25555 [Solirubrobacteraceae bacterium]
MKLDFDQLVTVMGIVLAAAVLPPSGAVVVLAFVVGLLCNVKRR